MTDQYIPRPEHRFTFGLWTVGNPGRDPFGTAVRAELDPVDTVHHLSELGAYGVSFHDNDLVPYDASPTMWHGKLFHIDLNAQRIGKFDQDFRFGSEGVRDAFYVVKVLEDAQWDGMRHFDAHPYRTEDADEVWDFARGCMRTYLIFAEKARRFHEDPEILEALPIANAHKLNEATGPAGGLAEILSSDCDEEALAAQGYGHERLDQLVTELLLGAR
jgi:hypothetical protein